MIRRTAAWTVMVMALGCSKKDPAPADPAASARPEAASAPAAAPSANTPAPAASATARSAGPPSKLFLVAESDGWIKILPGAHGGLLIGETDYEIKDDAPVMNGHAFDDLARYRKEGSFAGRLVEYGGRWPEAAWADIASFTERGNTNRDVYAYNGGGWAFSIGFGQWTEITAVAPYPSSSGLGSLVAASSGGFVKREVMIKTSSGLDFHPTSIDDETNCGTRLGSVFDVAVTPEGELFALGEDCKGGDVTLVERFDAKGASLGVTPTPSGMAFIPPAEGELGVISAVVAVSAREAFIAGQTSAKKPYFAAFDGAKWTPASLGPITAPLNALSAGADGTLWAVSDGKLWRRARGAAWTPVELPEGARVTGADAPGDDMVWAWGPSGAKGQAIYRSRPFKEVLKLKEAKLSAYSTDCKTPFVVLYTISTTAAPDYDFPATRKALKGHTELAGTEFLVTTSYQFGAIVPDQDLGRKLVAVVKAEVKGSKPQLVCMRPNIGRRFAFDLATGEVKPSPVPGKPPEQKK